MKKSIIGICLFFQAFLLWSQTTAISGIINDYTAVTAIPICNPCASTCDYVDVAGTAGFGAGDKVLLIQMKGASTDLSNTAAFGTIQSFGNAGVYEYKTIASVAGSRLLFTSTLYNTYDVAGLVQVVKVPQYVNANVIGKLTAQSWNGSTGGILAFDVTGTLTLNADIDATGLGFQGGIGASNGTNYPYNEKEYYYTGTIYELAAPKGEGIAVMVAGYELGKGAYANAGGGGDAHNGGGGGGSNAGAGGLGGNEFNAFTGSLANGIGGYAIPYTSGDRIYMGGGGGAGHQNQGFGTNGGNGGGIIIINAATISGNNHQIIASGDSSKSTFGGGNDGTGGAGAGGAIKIAAAAYTGNISLIANGGNGGDMTSTIDGHAPGAGGGGGVICLANATIPVNVITQVDGGMNGVIRLTSDAFGATSGATGKLLTSCNFVIPPGPKELKPNLGADIQLCNPVVANLDARLTGTWYTYAWYKNNILIPGETSQTYSTNETGRFKVVVTSSGCLPGIDSVDITTNTATALNKSFCAPPASTVNLAVTGSGKYKWWDDATVGNAVGKGLTYTTPPISSTTTYYVEDTSSITGSVGPTVLNTTGLNNGNSQLGFTLGQDIEITSLRVPFITYYSPAAGYPGFTITLEVVDQNGNSFIPAKTFTSNASLEPVPGNDGGNVGLYTFPFSGFMIQSAWGSNLRLKYISGTHPNGAANFNQGSTFAYPYNSTIPGVVTISGSYTNGGAISTSDYGFFYDWQFKTRTNLCLRVPVAATLSCTPGCVKPNSVSIKSGIGINDTLCAGNTLLLQKDIIDTVGITPLSGFYFSWRRINSTGSVLVTAPSKIYSDLSIPATTRADSGRYYLVVQDGLAADPACKDSAFILIIINQAPSIKGLIEKHQEICEGDAASIITESSPPKNYSGMPLFYQWYTTADSTGVPALSKISTSTNNTYMPGNPVNTLYYVRKDSVKYCAAVQTNFIKIRVNNSLVLDKIVPLENDTLCEALGSIFQLKGSVDSSVHASINKGYYFTWMKLQQPATMPVVVGVPGAYTDYPPVSRLAVESDSGTYYLIVQDGAGATVCMDTMRSKVVVYKTCTAVPPPCKRPNSVSIKLAGVNDTLCTGQTLHLQLDVIDTLPNPTEGYYFSWVKENALGTTVLLPPTLTYTDITIPSVVAADSGRYYLIVQDGLTATSSCTTSATAIPIIIHEPIMTPAVIAVSDTICEGSAPNLFAEINASTGGTGTPYRYQWYESTDSFKTVGGKALIAGEILKTYQAPALSSTTFFMRVDSAGLCPGVSTNILTIQVDKKIVAGVIGNDTIVCSGSPLNEFVEHLASLGGTGNYLYQWKNSFDNTTYTDIFGATAKDYQSPPLSITTYFKRIDSSGVCSSDETNVIKVVVVPGTNPGTTSGTNPAICYNTIPPNPLISLSAASGGTGGPGSDTYQWLTSTNNIDWTEITGAISLSYTETNTLTTTTYYRRRVGMGSVSCDTAYTLPIKIEVYPTLDPGSIPTESTICGGSAISIAELTPATGGGDETLTTYEWISSSDKGFTWVTAATTKNYDSPVLTDSVWYKRIAKTTCKNDTTNLMKVHVDPMNAVSITMAPTAATCLGSDVTFTTTFAGEGIAPIFKWFTASSVSGPWIQISGASGPDYTLINPQLSDDGVIYKVELTSSFSCNTGPVEASAALTVSDVIEPKVTIAADPASPLCDTTQVIHYTATPVQGVAGNPTYQWFDGLTNTAIAGATDISYTPAVKPANGDKIYVIMTSDLVCANPTTASSDIITLDVRKKPKPVISTKDTIICTPSEVMLKATGFTSGKNKLQWYKNGEPIDKATNSIYPVTAKDFPGAIYTISEDNGICATTTTGVKVLMLASPLVEAGSDIYAVEGEPISLNGLVSANTTYYVWIPSAGLSSPYILNPTLTAPDLSTTYSLVAYNNSNYCSNGDVVTIHIERSIKVPNVITINGDGTNDTWEIDNIENYPNAEFVIYNRWGNLVWKSTGYSKKWDGTNYRNGEVLPDGTYFYIINLHSVKVKNTVSGWVQIVK